MRSPSLLLVITLSVAGVTSVAAKNLPHYDESARKDKPGRAPFVLQERDKALVRSGAPVHRDDRFGVPTFLWAAPRGAGLGRSPTSPGTTGPEQAARSHLGEYAHLYGMDADDLRDARLGSVHDTGRGGIIVSFHQQIGGVEVFRDEIKVLMNQDHELLALSGYLRGSAAGAGRDLRFSVTASEAIVRAFGDYLSPKATGLDPRDLQARGEKPGGFESFVVDGRALEGLGLSMSEPIRVRKVLFDLPEGYEPAWHLELSAGPLGSTDSDYYAYVISATDGRVLLRHSLTASDSFSYRVWADTTGLRAPLEGPQGSAATPHPTGVPNGYQAPFTLPSLLTLQNGPISTNDPWLAPGATATVGNNADAYADLAAPDGRAGTDFRATTTSANTFDRTYNTALAPNSSQAQQMAAITQLFYDVNFLHDWFYDAGFNEVSRNAQTNNYGRGGLQNDSLKAEAQDYSGRDNANMSTPADGGRPRMQMYVWTGNGLKTVTIDAPPAIAATYSGDVATWGPTSFNITDDIVQALDGVGSTTDGCEAIGGAVSGKIAFIDRGTCNFTTKVENAQNAGAVGVIIANVASSTSPTVPPLMGGTPTITITIGTLSLNLADGDLIRGQLGGAVHGTLFREAAIDRDGTIDNQIVSHEWGHYISNRLIGNASGLTNNQGGSMGEGWGDFHAMLTTVRANDALVAATPDFTGAYAIAGYVFSGGTNNGYYYGIRRYPYSIDFGKNPLSFRHIGDGAPLTGTAPVAFGSAGTINSEVHDAGEVWTAMLWECYAALLRDSGRLTFDQAQDRMVDYLVAAYKLTPNAPTYLEARDAILAVALAGDPADYILFWRAFARRGAGIHAVAPDRDSFAHQGVVESFQPGIDLYFAGATLDDVVSPCDADGILDNNETGHLSITLENVGSIALNSTMVTVTTTNPNVTFPNGNMVAVPPMPSGATTAVSLNVAMAGATGLQQVDFTISYDDPGFRIPGAASQTSSHRGNYDDKPSQSAADDVESGATSWTITGNASLGQSGPWRRIGSPYSHSWLGPDVNEASDQYVVSPVLNVAPTGSFSFSFRHRHIFEYTIDPNLRLFDGGVLEISTNGGSTWTDIGASAVPGYTGTLATGGGNPIQGRPAYAQVSPGFPAFQTVNVNLGTTYQGQNVKIRFRVGSDLNVDSYGWEIDDVTFNNVTNLPFAALVTENGVCPDADMDGVNDFLDCAPSNPAVWSVPSPVRDLDLTGAGASTLGWSAPAQVGGVAIVYDVLRSDSKSSFAAAACVESNDSDLLAVDSGIPAPQQVYFYLIRSENTCGANLGATSSGTPRTGVNCP
ncbi:MAG TPA: myxosortase-dependent M36 family metallopeptidase [Candidatus Polarisedimenticolia bacterium]|jgi:hypothetical protein